jgi:hypothetical protein
MIQYTSNISQVVKLKVRQMQDLQNPDQMLRTVALAVLPELKKRVHVEGEDSSGSQIGTYSPGYMKLRTGNYASAERFKKGAKKGEVKNAGVSKSTGKPRPNYHRTGDTKVILSLTRQMENDLSVIAAGSGYGIGYNNPFNYQKSQWNEQTYGKRIWAMTQGERDLALKVAEDFVQQSLNQE